MSGFDNGTLQSGVFFQTKQFGMILRGFGPPVPQAGVVGDTYIDVQTWNFYEKRSAAAGDDIDPWGHYLFVVPAQYRASLKWFTSTLPTSDIGVPGDYCLLWGGYANYGIQPSIFGPKQVNGWPENGDGGTLYTGGLLLADIGDPILADVGSPILAASGTGSALSVGVSDEGPIIPLSSSTQVVATGLTSEIILPVPANATPGAPVQQLGLQSGPALVTVAINPLYTAEDQHSL